MGYFTRFTLDWVAKDEQEAEAIRKTILANEEARYCLGDDAKKSLEPGKWYDWKKDLTAFSVAFPKVLFTLKGAGEEAGDLWMAYAKAGRIQHEKATITFASCKIDGNKRK